MSHATRRACLCMISAGLLAVGIATAMAGCNPDCAASLTCPPPLVGNDGSPGDGGDNCISDEGSAKNETICDDMAIAPPPMGSAPPCEGGVPPGYTACKNGFSAYAEGFAEYFHSCLAKISADAACDDMPVNACRTALYNQGCPRPEVGAACGTAAGACEKTPSLDEGKCIYSLNILSNDLLNAYGACMVDPPGSCAGLGTCEQVHDCCKNYVLNQP